MERAASDAAESLSSCTPPHCRAVHRRIVVMFTAASSCCTPPPRRAVHRRIAAVEAHFCKVRRTLQAAKGIPARPKPLLKPPASQTLAPPPPSPMLSPFTSHCIVRSPLSQPHHTTSTFSSLSCGILTIGEDRETVYFPEQNLSTIATFKFDTVTPASSPIAACYTDLGKEGSTGAGLVAGTDSIMVTVGDQEEGRAVVEGDDGAGGLLQSVVDDVLAHLPTLTSHKPRLSVSWYSIHTTQSSGIIDMLKTASGGSTTEPGISPDLVLSHGGKGGGTRVNVSARR